MNKNLNFSAIRDDFPLLKKLMHGKPLIYFDSAATAQKPQVVIDALSDFYQNHYGTVHRAVYQLASAATKEYEGVRKKVKDFIKASKTEEIIFTKGTTEAINLVAASFGKAFIKPQDEVLITEMEHHSNIVPWQLMCQERGAFLKIAPITERGEVDLAAYARLLNGKTKIVSVAHISNALGTVNPIKEMVRLAYGVGAKVLIDGAQSVPHLPIDLQEIDCDFFAFSGHKLFGPTGIGVLYGKEELLAAMPPYQGGGDMIETVTFEKTSYNALPLKFEAGTPMIAEVIALGAAIDYLSRLGLDQIQRYEATLLHYATERLKEIPRLRIIGNSSEKSALISFFVEDLHPLDIGILLDLNGVAVRTGQHCAQPTMRRFGIPATLRISFAFYNNCEEIDAFIAILKTVLAKLG